MNWQKIKTLNASATSYTDNSPLEDEIFYLYKVVAYYQAIDCYSAPARSKYNEYEYFVRVYWSVDGVDETGKNKLEVYPNPASATVHIEGMEPSDIQMYNAFGQLVKTAQGTNEISVLGLPEGVYLLCITDVEGRNHISKVAVRKQ